jgi:hypothetical protein
MKKQNKLKDLLRGEIKLPIEQAVLVPSTQNQNHPISKQQFKKRVDDVRKYLGKNFGGYTSVQGTGGFVTDEGKLIKEPVDEVFSFAEKKNFPKKEKALIGQLKEWGHIWGQDSMGYELKGSLYHINTKKKKK